MDLILVNRPFVDRIPCSRSEPCNWPRKNSTVETSLIPRQNKFLTGLKALYCSEMAFFLLECILNNWFGALETSPENYKLFQRSHYWSKGGVLVWRRQYWFAGFAVTQKLCTQTRHQLVLDRNSLKSSCQRLWLWSQSLYYLLESNF